MNELARWIFPMVPILKENGEIICIDMRRANTAIIQKNHPGKSTNYG